MSNNVDIMYYDYMIESSIEDYKIMELLYSTKFNNLLNESTEEIAIYEANVFKTIAESIHKIFEKVVEFIKGLIEKITGNFFFKMNTKLIEQCKERVKSITSNERNDIRVEYDDITDDAWSNLQWAREQHQKMDVALKEVIKRTNEFLDRKYQKNSNDSNVSKDSMSKVKDVITDLNQTIVEKSDVKKMNKKPRTAKYDHIITVLNNYSDSEKDMKTLNDHFKTIMDTMKKHQKSMRNIVSNNNDMIIKKYNSSQLARYRDVINHTTSTIIKLCKFQLNMNILMYRNNEVVLRRFLSTTEYSTAKAPDTGSSYSGEIKALPYKEAEYLNDVYNFIED